MANRKYNVETELLIVDHKDGYRASNPPLYQSTTFKQDLEGGDNDYDYTRSGNPTRTFLQNHLAKIMGADKSFVVGSGMSCLDVILRLLNSGDEVIAGDDLYGGTHRLLTLLHNKKAVKLQHIDTSNVEVIKQTVTEKTRMIFLESPTNPLIKIVDLPAVTKYIKANYPNCLIVFDNTMMTPLLASPLLLGVDIQYESATKYLNGHHDIMAGVIATKNAKLADDIFFIINSTGAGLAPFDCWLLLRGLKTLSIRLERQQQNALKIAKFLESEFGLKVHYPGLKSHPQYNIHKKYNRGSGAVLSFETGDIKLSEEIVKKVDIYSVTVSFGCVNSLISMPCRMSHASIDAKTRAERALPEDLIRVCVGIENADDLIEDLRNAFLKAGVKPSDVQRNIRHTR